MTAWPTVHSVAARAILARLQLRGSERSHSYPELDRRVVCPVCRTDYAGHGDAGRYVRCLHWVELARPRFSAADPPRPHYYHVYFVAPTWGCPGWRGFHWYDDHGTPVVCSQEQTLGLPNLEDPP